MPNLTRDVLVEAAAKAVHADRCCPCDETGCVYPDDLWGEVLDAEIAVDAALTVLADDLDRETLLRVWHGGWRGGIGWAANHVRSLLPSTEGDQL